MKASIELTPEQLGEVLREYMESRGHTYHSYTLMPDDGVHVTVLLASSRPVAVAPEPAPAPARAVQGVPARGVAVVDLSNVPATTPASKEPEMPYDPTKYTDEETKGMHVVPREHNVEVDLEFARILEENHRILAEEKAKAEAKKASRN